MGRGRPPNPGTVEEKAAARRERVRNNVRALRQRRKIEAALADSSSGSDQHEDQSSTYKDGDTPSDDEASNEQDTVRATSRKSSNTSASSVMLLMRRQDDSKTRMLSAVNSGKLYSMAFIGTMRANFLPDAVYLPPATDNTQNQPWESDQFLWTPCAFWVTRAFAKASTQDTGLLKTAVLAIGMVMKSLEFQDQSLRVAALEMYARCIQGIRKSLEPLIADRSKRPQDSVAFYLSCHAAAMFELILNSDLSATMHHLRGVSQLICHLGDGRDRDGQSIAWLLLQDYRFAELGLCLKYRYISFSSVKHRQFENSSRLTRHQELNPHHNSHNLLVKITDIADEITAVMVQLDIVRPRLHMPESITKVRECLSTLTGIWEGYSALYASVIQFCGPSFIFRDTETPGPADGSVKFKTYDIGAAWCYNLMTQVYCLETSIDATTLLLEFDCFTSSHASPADSRVSGGSNESYEEVPPGGVATLKKLRELRKLHRAVCIKLTQCIQYFLQTDKGVTGQALAIFPLDAAINMLECENVRLQGDLSNSVGNASSSSDFDDLQTDIANVKEAKIFCKQLQERAKAFGLPAFHEAGNEYVSSLHQDQVVFAASV